MVPKLSKYHKEFGSVFKYFIAHYATLVIADYEMLEFLLTSHIFEKSLVYTFLHKWLGTGLLTASGEILLNKFFKLIYIEIRIKKQKTKLINNYHN